ncbi:hypothetical protein EDC94DRAFT_608044 [Helicostylum pulchrum]|nr:hypothetical protein EDC94DRAFT_608044 [Helicostylum pulchrum]
MSWNTIFKDNNNLRRDQPPDLSLATKMNRLNNEKSTLTNYQFLNDTTERTHRPFNSVSKGYNSTPVSSPRITARNEDSNTSRQQQMINNVNMWKVKTQIAVGGETAVDYFSTETGLRREIKPITPLRKVRNSSDLSVVEKGIHKPGYNTSSPIAIEDSDEDKSISSDDSYYTANESFIPTEEDNIKALEEDLKDIATQIKKITLETKNMLDLSKEIQVNLAAMKVGMSLGKSREELRNKPLETPPLLDEKRHYHESISGELALIPPQHSEIIMHPQRSKRIRRRFDNFPPNTMNNRYAPTAPYCYRPQSRWRRPSSAADFFDKYPVQPSTATSSHRANPLSETSTQNIVD